MTYTQEPKGLQFVNNLNMTTFGPLVSNLCWLIGSIAFTWVACVLLLDDAGKQVEAHHSYGLQLATALLFAWTGKTAAGVIDANNKRKAHPDYAPVAEARERAKMAGAVLSANTREHASPVAVLPVTPAIVQPTRPEPRPVPDQTGDEPTWADGRSAVL